MAGTVCPFSTREIQHRNKPVRFSMSPCDNFFCSRRTRAVDDDAVCNEPRPFKEIELVARPQIVMRSFHGNEEAHFRKRAVIRKIKD